MIEEPPRIERRGFLAQTVLGTASVVGTNLFGDRAAPTRTGAGGPVPPPGGADPYFAEGKVIGIHGDRLTMVGPDMGIRRVQADDHTDVWKLRHGVGLGQVAVGDLLYARGTAGPTGLFVANAVWVNIVNLHVTIAATAPEQLLLDYKGGRLVGHVVPGITVLVDLTTRSPTRPLPPDRPTDEHSALDPSRMRVGGHAQLVGAWHPGTDDVDIATLFT